MSNEYNEALLEPLKYYRENLKDTFQSITEDYFQELVNQSKVDINKNKDLIDKYTNVSENRDQSNSTYKRFGIIRTIDFIVGIGSLVYCVYQFSQPQMDILSIVICIAIIALCIGLYVYWIRPNRKSLEAKLNDLDATLSQMREDGYEMMQPLNELFHSVRVKEIKVQGEDSYMGTLIYHEIFGEKMIFKLAFIRYLRRFQREEHWK